MRTTTHTSEGESHYSDAPSHPEAPLAEGQIIVYQVPMPEPLRFLEPRESRDAADACARRLRPDARQKLYEDIARHGHIATAYAYPAMVEARYLMDPSPTPKFDNPKMASCRRRCSYSARDANSASMRRHPTRAW